MYCKEISVNICVILIHIFFTCIFPLTHKQYTLVSFGGRQPGLRPSITILWSFYKRKNNAKKNTNSAEWIKFVSAPLVAYCTDEKNTGISNLRSNLLPENDIKKRNKKIWSNSLAKRTSPDLIRPKEVDFCKIILYTTVGEGRDRSPDPSWSKGW